MSLKLVKGDNRTVLTASIANLSTAQPENMAGATVLLHVRDANDNTPLFDVTGDLLAGYVDQDGNLNMNAYTVLGSGGRVQFVFPAGALNINAGTYEAEIEIIYSGGGSQTVYDVLKLLVRE